jgi:hypothetical protein
MSLLKHMSLLKQKANRSSDRSRRTAHAALPKQLLTAAVLGGSAPTLFAGSAQAAWGTIPNGVACLVNDPLSPPTNPCKLNDKSPLVDDKQITLLPGDGVWFGQLQPMDSFEFTKTNEGYWQLDFDPDDVLTQRFRPSGDIFYKIEIDPSDPRQFSGVRLSTSDTGGGDYFITKTFYTGDDFSTPVAGFPVLDNPPSPVPFGAFAPISGTTIYVKDHWVIPADSRAAIDNFQNTYRQSSVPGPVPLLGAGAAFGFSRRMRRRLKGVSLA